MVDTTSKQWIQGIGPVMSVPTEVWAKNYGGPKYPKLFVENYNSTGQGILITWTVPAPSPSTVIRVFVRGLANGCYVQSSLLGNSNLAVLAGLTPVNDSVYQVKSGAPSLRTPAQLFADLVAVGAVNASSLPDGGAWYSYGVAVGNGQNSGGSSPHLKVRGSGYELLCWLDANAAYVGQDSNVRELRMFSGSDSSVGVKLTAGATAWASLSDEKWKKKKRPLDVIGRLEKFGEDVGYEFDWIKTARHDIGGIAQRIVHIFPESVVKPTKRGEPWCITYGPLALAALQGVWQLLKRQRAQNSRIAALEQKLRWLTAHR